jgi:hypothetical protein
MVLNIFDAFQKAKTAQEKWNSLSIYQKDLLGMRFIHDLLSSHGHVRILHYGEKVLSDGRTLSILRLEIGVGEFAFAIPRYTDSYLVLLDFALCDELMIEEGVPVAAPH